MGRETVGEIRDAVEEFLQPMLLDAEARFSLKVFRKALADVLETSEKERLDTEASAINTKKRDIEEKKREAFKCMVDILLSGKWSPSVYEVGRHASACKRPQA